MRIKSYFAPSVQAAIALARKEFGDDVTLVTSHVASLDNRHLGEYEVVFAIEEVIPTPAPEPEAKPEAVAEAPAPGFRELLQEAIQTPPSTHQGIEEKLEQIHSSLIALGLEASLVRSFMTMLKAVVPAVPAAPAPEEQEVVTAVEPMALAVVMEAEEEEPAPKPKITLIKSEAQPLKSEPAPAAPPVAAAPRPFLSLFEAARPEPRFSAAELAFMTSVSPSQEQKA